MEGSVPHPKVLSRISPNGINTFVFLTRSQGMSSLVFNNKRVHVTQGKQPLSLVESFRYKATEVETCLY